MTNRQGITGEHNMASGRDCISIDVARNLGQVVEGDCINHGSVTFYNGKISINLIVMTPEALASGQSLEQAIADLIARGAATLTLPV